MNPEAENRKGSQLSMHKSNYIHFVFCIWIIVQIWEKVQSKFWQMASSSAAKVDFSCDSANKMDFCYLNLFCQASDNFMVTKKPVPAVTCPSTCYLFSAYCLQVVHLYGHLKQGICWDLFTFIAPYTWQYILQIWAGCNRTSNVYLWCLNLSTIPKNSNQWDILV